MISIVIFYRDKRLWVVKNNYIYEFYENLCFFGDKQAGALGGKRCGASRMVRVLPHVRNRI